VSHAEQARRSTWWALLLSVLTVGACRSRYDIAEERRAAAECEAGTCLTIVDDTGGFVGVEDDTRNGNLLFCKLIARRPGTPSAPAFEAPMGMRRAGSIVALDGRLAKVERCYRIPGSPFESSHLVAVLLLDPKEYASLAPAKGHLVITGEAVLDGVRAETRLARDDQGQELPGTLEIAVDDPPPGQAWSFLIREGATFSWAGHVVEVVRIVDTPAAGWVEIAIRS
jgi:hypothetical protein